MARGGLFVARHCVIYFGVHCLRFRLEWPLPIQHLFLFMSMFICIFESFGYFEFGSCTMTSLVGLFPLDPPYEDLGSGQAHESPFTDLGSERAPASLQESGSDCESDFSHTDALRRCEMWAQFASVGRPSVTVLGDGVPRIP